MELSSVSLIREHNSWDFLAGWDNEDYYMTISMYEAKNFSVLCMPHAKPPTHYNLSIPLNDDEEFYFYLRDN